MAVNVSVYDGYQCGGGSEFTTNARIYGACRDQEYAQHHPEDLTVEGCDCDNMHLIDDHGSCVALEMCTCYDEYAEGNKIKNAGEISQRVCTNW